MQGLRSRGKAARLSVFPSWEDRRHVPLPQFLPPWGQFGHGSEFPGTSICFPAWEAKGDTPGLFAVTTQVILKSSRPQQLSATHDVRM